MTSTRPNSLRAKAAIIFLTIMIGATILYIIGLFAQIYILQYSVLDHAEDFQRIFYIAIGVALIKLLYYFLFLMSGIFFILWMVRAYRNIQITLPNSKFAYKPWVSAVVWFVPFLNLIGPYQIVSNLFDKSERYLMSEGRIDLRPNYDIVKGIWWSLCIASFVVIVMSVKYELGNRLSLLGPIAEIIGFFLSLIALFFAIRMIRNYMKYEKLLAEISPEKSIISFSNDDLLDAGI